MITKLKKALTSWKAISPRLLSARFLHQSGHLSVIVCYVPTESSDDAAKDQFYHDLSVVVKPGVHTNDFATIHGIHTSPAEDNTSNQLSTPQSLCEYGRGDRESWRNR